MESLVPGSFTQYLADFVLVLLVMFAQFRTGRLLIRTAKGRWPGSTSALYALAALAAVSLMVGFAAGYHQVADAVPLPRKAVGWLHGGTFLWCFGSTGGYYIYALWKLLTRSSKPDEVDPARRRLIRTAGGAAAGAPFLLAGFGTFVERTNFGVREVVLPVEGLPDDLRGLRLVQLSDIHLSPYLSEREFARAIDAANELHPHLVVVTGDLISTAGDPLEACLRQIARLRADAGVAGCLGNHEVYARAERFTLSHGAQLGIRFLRRTWADFRFGRAQLRLSGVEYQRISDREFYLRGAEKMIRPGAVNVLLSHNPDVFPVAARKGFDITLSGHTHGGQVQAEILNQSLNMARFLTPYVYGLYQQDGRSAYVTRGIGTIGMPTRIGAPPEIALLRIERAASGNGG